MIKEHDNIKTMIDFGGFYGMHDLIVDADIETSGIDPHQVDFTATYQNYALAWIDRFNNHTGLGLVFLRIDSPRFYNYRTDYIEVFISNDDQRHLNAYLSDDNFIDWANDRLSPKSGFISFYKDLEDLKSKAETDTHDKSLLLGIIIDYIIERHGINDYIEEIEYEIVQL